MPPKVKITKEDIIDAATEIVRENGAEAINARELANVLIMIAIKTENLTSNNTLKIPQDFSLGEFFIALLDLFPDRSSRLGR